MGLNFPTYSRFLHLTKKVLTNNMGVARNLDDGELSGNS